MTVDASHVRACALEEAAKVIDFHVTTYRLGFINAHAAKDDPAKDRCAARVRTAEYLACQVRMQINDPMPFNQGE